MNIKSPLLVLLVSLTFTAASSGLAQSAGNSTKSSETASGKLIRVTEKDATWVAQARKNYPLEVCVVSEEKLGSMGKSPEYIYRVDGQPDRLVVFCCSGCDEDFLKDAPAHLAKIDAAQSKRK
jgi:hypothetical protein